MTFATPFTRILRLEILRVLREAPAGQANSTILTTAVREIGVNATGDQVRTAIGWLAEQELLVTADVNDLVVATLTERGSDVAIGRAKQDGVARPSHVG